MQFFRKLLKGDNHKSNNDSIVIYLDAEKKKSIETVDQTVSSYQQTNQFQNQQFLYLVVSNRRTNQVRFRRKLNEYEKLSECSITNPELKSAIVIGYSNQRNNLSRLGGGVIVSESSKFIRLGTLLKYSDTKGSFEECQLKLHHDYLTFYKLKEKEKKVSFMPLENLVIEVVDEKKNVFTLKDKFKNIIFKTSSKEDMFGWLVAIADAIKIRNSQIYMDELKGRLHKAIKSRLTGYFNKCLGIKDEARIIPLDEIGRKALKLYFRKTKVPEVDCQMLSIIESYLYMCKCRRQKGEAYSEGIITSIRESINQLAQNHGEQLSSINISPSQDSKLQFVKTIEEIMKYLDNKYRKQVIDKKHIYMVFQNFLVEQYRENKKIPLKTLYGHSMFY